MTINESDYDRTDGAITATAIKAGAVTMAHMRAAMTGHGKAQTPAMRWGSLVHASILQPDTLKDGLVVWGSTRRGKDWEAFRDANADKTILTEDEHERLMDLVLFVRRDPDVWEVLKAVHPEVERQWNIAPYGRGKCRLDGEAPNYWLELKTTAATSRAAYAAQHYRMGYDLQLGWYSIGAGVHKPCKLITVCTGDVPDVVVYHVAPDLIEAGREKAVEIATRYRACEAAGVFPGASGGDGEVRFEPPAWAVSGGVEVDMSEGTMEASEL